MFHWLKPTGITEESCESTVEQCFGPLASELGLHLVRLRKILFKDDSPHQTLVGVSESKGGAPVQFYEIVSPHFTLRVRIGVGPWTEREKTSLVVCLVPTELKQERWDESHDEIGVYRVAAYYGNSPKQQKIQSRGSFEREAKRVALLAQQYCKPFLLGQTADFPKIRQRLDEIVEQESVRLKELLSNLPPNVKQMWKREGESHAEWTKRLQA